MSRLNSSLPPSRAGAAPMLSTARRATAPEHREVRPCFPAKFLIVKTRFMAIPTTSACGRPKMPANTFAGSARLAGIHTRRVRRDYVAQGSESLASCLRQVLFLYLSPPQRAMSFGAGDLKNLGFLCPLAAISLVVPVKPGHGELFASLPSWWPRVANISDALSNNRNLAYVEADVMFASLPRVTAACLVRRQVPGDLTRPLIGSDGFVPWSGGKDSDTGMPRRS
jgi:hypothetical protein